MNLLQGGDEGEKREKRGERGKTERWAKCLVGDEEEDVDGMTVKGSKIGGE